MSPVRESLFNIARPGKPAGFWRVGDGGLRFAIMRRPSWLARFCARWLLEWTWEDNERSASDERIE